jgi:hypothetical protein
MLFVEKWMELEIIMSSSERQTSQVYAHMKYLDLKKKYGYKRQTVQEWGKPVGKREGRERMTGMNIVAVYYIPV